LDTLLLVLLYVPKQPVLPVDADGSEIKNGSGTAHDIKGDPGVAQCIAEHPARVVHLQCRNTYGDSDVISTFLFARSSGEYCKYSSEFPLEEILN